jgi:predicted AAA+ superfamily ATPase
LYQKIAELVSSGMKPNAILFVNFEDGRLDGMDGRQLRELIEEYFKIFPQYRAEGCVFMFDEIHVVDGWQNVIRTVLDQEKAQVYLSGSSAKMLSTEIATNLRGRSLAVEVFPFSFSEFLLQKGIPHSNINTSSAEVRSQIQHQLRSYLTQGGFPEVTNLEPNFSNQILQNYVDTVILRDVVERHNITSINPLRQLTLQILRNPSNLMSINKFHGDMRARAIPISKDTLYAIFGHLEDSYLFQSISIHSSSDRVRQTNPHKVYPIDTGIALAFARSSDRDIGKILETATFLGLRRICKNIDYFYTKDGYKVDFILGGSQIEDHLVQSCSQMDAPETRDRELRALRSGMKEKGQKVAWIVSLEQEEIEKKNLMEPYLLFLHGSSF